MTEAPGLDRGLGRAADLAGERDADDRTPLRAGCADTVAGQVERVHGMRHDRRVPLERERRRLAGEGAVAAAGQPEVVDVALDQGAGESAHVSGGVVEDVGHDIGDHRDLAPHHVDVVRRRRRGRPRHRRDRRGRGEPHGPPREVTAELAQHVAVVVEQPQAAGGADGRAGCGHAEGDGVDRLETRGKTGRHAAAERVPGAGGVDDVDLQGGHVDEVAAGQHVGTVRAGLHHRATYAGSLERTQSAGSACGHR